MKEEIRKKHLNLRSRMSKEEQEKKSQLIYEKIVSCEEYKNADKVFVYIDMGSEVKTKSLIKKAWQDKKTVAVPVTRKNRMMYFIRIKDFDNLIKTKFGTEEPTGEIDEQIFPDDKTLFIVPGSVFDESKNRCGYGGGFYDTYIEKHNIKKPIGICYDFQVLKEIQTEQFDRKMFKIITEERIIE